MSFSESPDRSLFFFKEGGKWGFLSNFHGEVFWAPDPSQWLPLRDQGIKPTYTDSRPTMRFYCSEQYFMYCKALQFSDKETAAEILKHKKPRKCKSLGRGVKGFDENEWELYREKIMEEALWWKFGGGAYLSGETELSSLGEKLLATRDAKLVEASPYDRFWGCGFDEASADRQREEWGINMLGQCLMEVRQRLAEQRSRPQYQSSNASRLDEDRIQ